MGINALCHSNGRSGVEMDVVKSNSYEAQQTQGDRYTPAHTLLDQDRCRRSMPTMRVAVAGTCGLALLIAQGIQESTNHQVIILSRFDQPILLAQGYQCQVVDYKTPSSLQHALMGVDTVISTVTGKSQLRLIEAAVQCRVRRFAPAEFEGQPGQRAQNNILDRGKSSALTQLQHYAAYIQSTVFVCGIFYERFAVGGLRGHQLGVNLPSGEGDYIADVRNMTAVAPVYDAANNLSYLCLTSIYDVARFVVRALDMPQWPVEMSMCGERMSVNALIDCIKICRGRPLHPIDWQNPAGLQYQLSIAEQSRDVTQQQRVAGHLATAEGRYDFVSPGYLNTMYPDIVVSSFQTWLSQIWAGVP